MTKNPAEMLGQLIRAAREGRKRSNLAQRVGISNEFLRRIELGIVRPSGETLDRILGELDVPPPLAQRCWDLLAQAQVDPVVQAHVKVGMSNTHHQRRNTAVAASVATWTAEMFALPDAQKQSLKKNILTLLGELHDTEP